MKQDDELIESAKYRLEEVLNIPEEYACRPHEETIRIAIKELEESINN